MKNRSGPENVAFWAAVDAASKEVREWPGRGERVRELPKGAKFEAELARGFALWDVSHLLPTNPKTKVPTRGKIERLYMHHSGAMGLPGYEGARASAKYVIRQRNFPTAAYHYWLPYAPEVDESARWVVYRLVQDKVRAYHTGSRCNGHGLGICWQGNLSESEPSREQYDSATALVPWLLKEHGLTLPDALSMHCEAGQYGGKPKPSCPGKHVARWVRNYRVAPDAPVSYVACDKCPVRVLCAGTPESVDAGSPGVAGEGPGS